MRVKTMERVKIKETNLQFVNPLSERYETNQIVIHHLGSVRDIDASAAQVHDIHINTYIVALAIILS